MNTASILFAILKADFLERTRRSSFLVTLCLALYLGYGVNTGQILIKLENYRGIYNSAWVGSLMALVITFFLGLLGFYLVKNTIERDERTGVGQILATTALTRTQYLLGKWLSNFAVLSSLVVFLALAAVFMQLVYREDAQLQLWALVAPFLWLSLPMMALVAAFAVFFETVPWLKGGFGNLVYFFVFFSLLIVGVQLPQIPWLDVIGLNLVGSSMRAAAKAAFPTYGDTFTLAMISGKPLETFLWGGLNWSPGLIFQRLMWVGVSLGMVLAGSLFFNRFDTHQHVAVKSRRKPLPMEETTAREETNEPVFLPGTASLTPLASTKPFHLNFFRLAWLETLLLVKGIRWYWLAGMAGLWVGCAVLPTENLRRMSFMLSVIYPVLVWSRMGEREARNGTESLIFHANHSGLRLLLPAWLAGVLIAVVAASGALVGRVFHAEPAGLLPWVLSALFIPSLALALGIWSRGSKAFEVIYSILWYLGPFNPQNGLAAIDYLGIHSRALVNMAPLFFAGLVFVLMLVSFWGRRRQTVI